MNGRGAEVHSFYRQAPKVPLPPANPHEYSRNASRLTVRPGFDRTVVRCQRSGVKFRPSVLPSKVCACPRSLPIVRESSPAAQDGNPIVNQ